MRLHIYDTNVFLKDGISTLHRSGIELQLADNIEVKGKQQKHNEYKWFAIEDADPDVSKSADPDVHKKRFGVFQRSVHDGWKPI